MNVGELRRALDGVPDDLPVLLGDDYDRGLDSVGFVGVTTTFHMQRIDGRAVPAGVVVLRIGDEPPAATTCTSGSSTRSS